MNDKMRFVYIIMNDFYIDGEWWKDKNNGYEIESVSGWVDRNIYDKEWTVLLAGVVDKFSVKQKLEPK